MSIPIYKTIKVMLPLGIALLFTHAYADTSSTTVDNASDLKKRTITLASYLEKPNFRIPPARLNLPLCHCDEKGEPLADCRQQRLHIRSEVIVNAQGIPESAKILQSSGYSRLDRAINSELRQTTFNPFLRHSKPIIGRITIPIEYQYKPDMPAICYERRQAQLPQ